MNGLENGKAWNEAGRGMSRNICGSGNDRRQVTADMMDHTTQGEASLSAQQHWPSPGRKLNRHHVVHELKLPYDITGSFLAFKNTRTHTAACSTRHTTAIADFQTYPRPTCQGLLHASEISANV